MTDDILNNTIDGPKRNSGRVGHGPLGEEMWELFCDAIARGATNSNAVRAAGYNAKQPHQTATALLKRPEIVDRIGELREYYRLNPIPAPEMPEPSLEWVTKQYVKAIMMSEACEDRSSMISGLSALSKLKGYMIERTEARTGPLDELSPDQLRMIVNFAEKSTKAISVDVPSKVIPKKADD